MMDESELDALLEEIEEEESGDKNNGSIFRDMTEMDPNCKEEKKKDVCKKDGGSGSGSGNGDTRGGSGSGAGGSGSGSNNECDTCGLLHPDPDTDIGDNYPKTRAKVRKDKNKNKSNSSKDKNKDKKKSSKCKEFLAKIVRKVKPKKDKNKEKNKTPKCDADNLGDDLQQDEDEGQEIAEPVIETEADGNCEDCGHDHSQKESGQMSTSSNAVEDILTASSPPRNVVSEPLDSEPVAEPPGVEDTEEQMEIDEVDEASLDPVPSPPFQERSPEKEEPSPDKKPSDLTEIEETGPSPPERQELEEPASPEETPENTASDLSEDIQDLSEVIQTDPVPSPPPSPKEPQLPQPDLEEVVQTDSAPPSPSPKEPQLLSQEEAASPEKGPGDSIEVEVEDTVSTPEPSSPETLVPELPPPKTVTLPPAPPAPQHPPPSKATITAVFKALDISQLELSSALNFRYVGKKRFACGIQTDLELLSTVDHVTLKATLGLGFRHQNRLGHKGKFSIVRTLQDIPTLDAVPPRFWRNVRLLTIHGGLGPTALSCLEEVASNSRHIFGISAKNPDSQSYSVLKQILTRNSTTLTKVTIRATKEQRSLGLDCALLRRAAVLEEVNLINVPVKGLSMLPKELKVLKILIPISVREAEELFKNLWHLETLHLEIDERLPASKYTTFVDFVQHASNQTFLGGASSYSQPIFSDQLFRRVVTFGGVTDLVLRFRIHFYYGPTSTCWSNLPKFYYLPLKSRLEGWRDSEDFKGMAITVRETERETLEADNGDDAGDGPYLQFGRKITLLQIEVKPKV